MDFSKHHTKFFSLIIILAIIFIVTLRKHVSYFIWGTNITHWTINNDPIDNPVKVEVLLVYVYSKTHSHAFGNLKYFVENAVRENDGVDYYFILQNVNNRTVNESEMPILPKRNAHYIQHENVCYDFGTAGWFFNTYAFGNPWINQTTIIDQDKKLNLSQYKYFILMNSSIRGPFFPPYFLEFLSDYKKEFDKTFYWYYVFTKRINDKVKLIGCTISCAPVPHVQSYVLVTDFIGFKIMLKPGSDGGSRPEGIFGCYPLKGDVSLSSEVASSNRILQSGFMIDSLLTKYQDVNFNQPHNHQCNHNQLPYFDKNLEGTSLEPYEVVFVKYTDAEYLQISRTRGQLYERWIENTKKHNRSIW